ncbi:DUF4833 domain-containing protein [Rufibacter immobilis]|uniref:DUF4833 domain-containing protein n=1 Tax=Rufibacter immobilis TaxID=1348778 RepID=UPI0035EEC3D6
MRRFLFSVLVGMVVWLATGQQRVQAQATTKTNTQQDLPVPKGISNLLFYVQRDPNTNTIVYELNLDSKGNLNQEEPIRIYWMRYADGGHRQDLNFIQRKFAYGLHVKKINPEKYELKFVCYDKRTLYLMKGADGRFHVYTTIGKKQSILSRVFVRIEGGTFWVPNVVYAEFTGQEAAARKEIIERFKP